jgi:thioredoxin-dependent peroxiredoxin
MDLQPGDKAPAFKLATEGGGEISLSKLKGRAFVLYFYPKDDTSGCTKEALDFSQHADAFKSLGVEVIGVSKDTVESHERFKSKHRLNLVLASDVSVGTAQRYSVWVEKSMYGRRYMGMERATFLIDAAGKIRQVWRKVKVTGHAEAVLTAAKKL